MIQRPRRNRKNHAIRSLVQETSLTVNDLIAPLFVVEEADAEIPIASMPGQYRFGQKRIMDEIKELKALGIKCVSLFPALSDSEKDKEATESWNRDHFFQRVISEIKSAHPEMLVMTDVAMDPYSSDGHDGYVDEKTGEILNDRTLDILGKMSLCQAQSGSDILGPSDMMDGRVGFIRNILDSEGFVNTSIMSYTAKYCSSFYGPFRDALDSAPKAGDKKTYQMSFTNTREALLETKLDEQEGADILMVKPGLPYLDVLAAMRKETTLPLAIYNVSGEYAMIKAASERGWLDGEKVMMEALTSFKRAGADMILTYFSKEAAKLLA